MKKMPDCIRNHFDPVDSVMVTSLSNVGMILHCAPVLMNIGWIESYKADFKYYYDGISPSIACFLEKMDKERTAVAEALGVKVESVCEWIKRVYNVEGDTLYECIKNNRTYEEIDAPMTINHRYIFEDVPCSLVPIESAGKKIGIATPHISTIIELASAIMGVDYRKTGRKFETALR